VIRGITAKERDAMISDEAKAMVLRGMMPQVPTTMPQAPTISQLERHLERIGVTPLSGSTRRGGRKTHKKRSHPPRRLVRKHSRQTRHQSTRRQRRTQRKH